MPQIDIAGFGLPQRATQREVVRSGGDISALNAPLRAAGQLGGVAANIGARLADQTLEANARREEADFKGLVNTRFGEFRTAAESGADFEELQPLWANTTKELDKSRENASRRGKLRIGNYWAQASPLYEQNVTDIIRQSIDDRAITDSESAITEILASPDFSVEAEFLSAQGMADGGADIASEFDAKLVAVDDILDNPVFDKPENRARAKAIRNNAVSDILLGLGASEKVLEGDNAGLIDLDAGIKAIRSTNATNLQKQDAIKDLELQWADEKRGRAVLIEENQEATIDAINKAEFAGDLATMQDLVENGVGGVGVLPARERRVYIRAIRDDLEAIKKGTKIVTDYGGGAYERVRLQVDSVANGDITYADGMIVFQEEKKNLSATDRRSLIEKLIEAKEAKPGSPATNRTDQLARSTIAAFEQNDLFLLPDNPTDELLSKWYTPEIIKNYRDLGTAGKEQFSQNHSKLQQLRYTNDYDQFIKENPDATVEQKEEHIQNLMKPAKVESAKGWFMRMVGLVLPTVPLASEISGTRRKVESDLPSLKTVAAVNALPSGTKYIWTDGKEYTRN